MAAVQVQQRLPLPLASPQQLRRSNNTPVAVVCRYWKSGHCSRNPCRFLHADAPMAPYPSPIVKKRNNTWVNTSSRVAPNPNADATTTVPPATQHHAEPEPEQQPPPKRARQAEESSGAHSWCVGDGIRGIARLQGHARAVTGVAVPEASAGSGRQLLYSGSLDGMVRAWDCNTGWCIRVAPAHEGAPPVGRLVAMGPWVLAGVGAVISALHTGTGKVVQLRLGPTAQAVNAMLAEDDDEDGKRLFAGGDDGAIYIWRLDRERQTFDEIAALTVPGLHASVSSLAQGKGALYASHEDGAIRAWDLETRRCICSFAAHDSKVTALLCWDMFLLSSSHDGTVKAWRSPSSKPDREGGDDGLEELEEHCTHKEEGGERVVAMDGTYDADKKPVLLVSRCDGVVVVYGLPSFEKRGQILCNGEAGAISVRTPGVVFIGDQSGEVRVAKWTTAAAAEAQV
ncbi:hypothetical protein BRADI_1g75370v3 [Brachypodium distachyon]|uniref:C3H1-type domain-containing protein n=2 Tax=Brachypodium distachyon TaxID=15368 RepID=A0A0Q3HL60_BRADI|nr:hypothetical protein BRADI_1g75370v3 [Brachypodium distachyon]